MFWELVLDLAYIALAVGVVAGIHRLRLNGYFASGFTEVLPGDPLAGAMLLLMAVVFFFLVIYVGMTPPMVFHIMTHGGPKPHPKLADLFAIGPLGNLAQLVGAGTALYMFFQATSVVIVLGLIGAVVTTAFHW